MLNTAKGLSEEHFLPQLHPVFGKPSPSFCKMSAMSKTNGATTPETTEPSHIKVVDGDPPMLRLEINLYSWERGDSEIEVVLPHGGELSDLLHWALPEQRLVICGNLRARIHEELAEVFTVLSGY